MPRESASSAALSVTTSWSFAHFRILVREVSCCHHSEGRVNQSAGSGPLIVDLRTLTPNGMLRSHRYDSNCSATSFSETSATCELSIAWRA